MDSNRATALTAGVLFIVATVAALASSALAGPLLSRTDYLSRVSANANQVSSAGLLQLIAAGASVGIAISIYPILKKWGRALALGSVVFRAIEAVMYLAGAVSLLSLINVGQAFARAGAGDRSFQAIGDSLLVVRDEAVLVGVFAFSVGALIYYALFYESRLIPRWLSGWGIAGIVLTLAACLNALFSQTPITSSLLVLPIALQEMVLALWLIARGFSPSALSAPENPNDVGRIEGDVRRNGAVGRLSSRDGISA